MRLRRVSSGLFGFLGAGALVPVTTVALVPEAWAEYYRRARAWSVICVEIRQGVGRHVRARYGGFWK